MKLTDIIASARMLEGSEFAPLTLSEEGEKLYQEAYKFSGSFKYDKQDLKQMCSLMAGKVETDQLTIYTQGFIAGLDCKFAGHIHIFVKRQNQ